MRLSGLASIISSDSKDSGENEAKSPVKKISTGRETRRRSLFKSLLMDYKRLEEKFVGADSRKFNIFKYVDDIGRDKAMSMLTFHMFV